MAINNPNHADADHPEDEGAFWAVVPAGGAGTRLWPLSRAERPKFLLPLVGERSLLQQTADRLTPLTTVARTLVVCGPTHAAAIARQLPGLPEENIIIEPSPKGSGPAIGLAAALIARRNRDAIMGSFAADHDIRDVDSFATAVRAAICAARHDWLVTIGLTPTRPETGYGYIERTDDVIPGDGPPAVFRAERFVEKPNLERASVFVASGRHLWNASIFIWKVSTFLKELKRLQPTLHAGLMRIATAWGRSARERVLMEVWADLPESTIDHGVMERAARVAVVPAAMGWSDVGDWHGLGELLTEEPAGMVGRADCLTVGGKANVVWSETNRAIALVGVEDLAVVDTSDALLVAHRSHAQDVRQVVERLRKLGRHEVL